jgi:hypothetical protein
VAVSLSGIEDDPKPAGRRLGDIQDNADLHLPMVRIPAAGNISQLAYALIDAPRASARYWS